MLAIVLTSRDGRVSALSQSVGATSRAPGLRGRSARGAETDQAGARQSGLTSDRFDAFTHKPTSQYSLAYEKASIIFNISAVLSCHAAHQNRHEDVGLKTSYHSFQASAGMFTYINENFLHAPSTDLSRETVKTLIAIMLAQAQEVFLEKQIVDGKKVGLLAKLASQAAFLYTQAVEGAQENVASAVFEKVWLLVVQVGCSEQTVGPVLTSSRSRQITWPR